MAAAAEAAIKSLGKTCDFLKLANDKKLLTLFDKNASTCVLASFVCVHCTALVRCSTAFRFDALTLCVAWGGGGGGVVVVLAAGKAMESVLFSDSVYKINRKDKPQKRDLVVTTLNIYNFEPASYGKFKRFFSISKLKGLVLQKGSNEMLLKVKDEYDYRYVMFSFVDWTGHVTRTPPDCGLGPAADRFFVGAGRYEVVRQAELVKILSAQYTSLTGGLPLTVTFSVRVRSLALAFNQSVLSTVSGLFSVRLLLSSPTAHCRRI